MMNITKAAFAALAFAGGWSAAASATPYASALNIVTGIAITGGTGSIAPLVTGSATQSTTTAQYGALSSGFNDIGVVGGATNPMEATAGPGPFPGQNNFDPHGGLNMGMIGSRADARISAGVAGTVTARTIAETYGTDVGSAQGKNTAAINFTATLSDPGTIKIAFDLHAILEASTAPLAGESSNATVKNDILITDALGNIVFEFTPNGNLGGNVFGGTVLSDPFNANGQANSSFGIPPTALFDKTGSFAAVSNTLAAGTYNIAIVSSSQTSTQPGQVVPEPASFVLLGFGLIALGAMAHSRPIRRNTRSG
jgi:hypothetical protein